jgi:hypothetical protein
VDTKSIADVCARWNIQNGNELEHVLKSSFGVTDTIKHVRRYQEALVKKASASTPGPVIVGRRADVIIIDDPLERSPYP